MNNALKKGYEFIKTPESDNWTTSKETWSLITFLFTKEDILWDPAFYDGKEKAIFDELGYNMVHEKRNVFEDATFEWAKGQGVTKIVCK